MPSGTHVEFHHSTKNGYLMTVVYALCKCSKNKQGHMNVSKYAHTYFKSGIFKISSHLCLVLSRENKTNDSK